MQLGNREGTEINGCNLLFVAGLELAVIIGHVVIFQRQT